MQESVQWGEAASLVIAAKCSQDENRDDSAKGSPQNKKADYKILMLKRSGKSSFMPGVHVFPGGRICDQDYSTSWQSLFREAGVHSLEQLGYELTGDGVQPPMFTRHKSSWSVPADIAFRICAIRETFEESAVLLIRPNEHARTLQRFTPVSTDHLFGHSVPLKHSVLEEWRQKVMKDPSQFIELCKWIGGVPDVWSLAIWNNWLTPVFGKQKIQSKRFDTIFYVCCLNRIPYALHDKGETIKSKWYSPREMLKDNEQSKITLIGPQVYEVSRIANFICIEDLQRFSLKRSRLGCERYMPVIVKCIDGILTLLPGDELYPGEPDYEGKEDVMESEKTVAELFSSAAQQCNRRTQNGGYWSMKCTGTPRFGHIHPHISNKTNSAL